MPGDGEVGEAAGQPMRKRHAFRVYHVELLLLVFFKELLVGLVVSPVARVALVEVEVGRGGARAEVEAVLTHELLGFDW